MNLISGILSAALLARGIIDDEIRAIKRQALALVSALAFLAVAFISLLAAVGYFLWGLHQYFAVCLSPAAAAGIVSVIAL